MAAGVLPIFEHIADRQLAQAASEPFLERDNYTLVPTTPSVNEIQPISVGVAYLEDEVFRYGFALSSAVSRPLHEADVFMNAYDAQIGGLHRKMTDVKRKLPESIPFFLEEAAALLDKTKSDKLSAIAMFAILKATQSSDTNQVLVFSRRVAEEMPLEKRGMLMKTMHDPARIEGVKDLISEFIESPDEAIAYTNRRITKNTLPENYAVVHRALTHYLPIPSQARKHIADEERVGAFFSLPRKERRKLLTIERKQAG
jgi:hypothetical protein